ncbi:proteolipid protein 2 isoform X2 [Salmo salar]|uniref:Proteolipid protein 2 n=1 Tax=Salmo salar TaxID=8030 RepID=A0A1S3LLI4_SALSA|nr:proteolipid protein 2 isoform X2 [Salmo salar]|eukprot:XP_013991746.1 PREDICTED: proteolipid protein 2-like isoform X2 [Salmo salar]
MADMDEGCLENLNGKTLKGTILIAEILISLIILICCAASFYGGYSVVAICEMVSAIIFFVIFMMEMDKSIQVVNWVWSDLLRASSGTGLYLITSLMSLIHGAGDGACIAGVCLACWLGSCLPMMSTPSSLSSTATNRILQRSLMTMFKHWKINPNLAY